MYRNVQKNLLRTQNPSQNNNVQAFRILTTTLISEVAPPISLKSLKFIDERLVLVAIVTQELYLPFVVESKERIEADEAGEIDVVFDDDYAASSIVRSQ